MNEVYSNTIEKLRVKFKQTANGKCQFLPCDWLNFPFTCCLLLILYLHKNK